MGEIDSRAIACDPLDALRKAEPAQPRPIRQVTGHPRYQHEHLGGIAEREVAQRPVRERVSGDVVDEDDDQGHSAAEVQAQVPFPIFLHEDSITASLIACYVRECTVSVQGWMGKPADQSGFGTRAILSAIFMPKILLSLIDEHRAVWSPLSHSARPPRCLCRSAISHQKRRS